MQIIQSLKVRQLVCINSTNLVECFQIIWIDSKHMRNIWGYIHLPSIAIVYSIKWNAWNLGCCKKRYDISMKSWVYKQYMIQCNRSFLPWWLELFSFRWLTWSEGLDSKEFLPPKKKMLSMQLSWTAQCSLDPNLPRLKILVNLKMNSDDQDNFIDS